MPWYEPCSRFGYSKFYSNPSLRTDSAVVSDEYLQSLVRAFRQGYVNAGGPDYEDSDSNLLDHLAENCVSSTSAAAALGASQARQDKAAGQDYHPQSIAPSSAPIAPTPSTGNAEHMATVFAQPTNPQGQPMANPVMPPPQVISFGDPASAAGGAGGVGGAGGAGGGGGAGGSLDIPWWLIVAGLAGVYLLVNRNK